MFDGVVGIGILLYTYNKKSRTHMILALVPEK